MSKEFDQAAIIAALEQRSGMSEGKAKSLEAFNSAQADWFATCPKCLTALQGTLAELRGHRCGSEG